MLTAAEAPGGLRPLGGEARSVLVELEDTLLDIAYRQRVGYEALMRLNPDVDPWIPNPGTVVQLPSRYILPDVPPEGLVINVPEMRLFDFTVESPPEVIAAAVGDADDPTLLGEFRVGRKRIDPVWRVPKSIREEKPGLPAQVPPGPDNPLGSRWMTIGQTSYGIHGTNIRWSIGRQATHGCVRLYEEDIRRLYDRVPEGTPIRIVYQPFKWGAEGGRIYFEAHPDIYGRIASPLEAALALPRSLGLLGRVDVDLVWHAVEEARGAPIAVGTLPEPVTPRAGPATSRRSS